MEISPEKRLFIKENSETINGFLKKINRFGLILNGEKQPKTVQELMGQEDTFRSFSLFKELVKDWDFFYTNDIVEEFKYLISKKENIEGDTKFTSNTIDVINKCYVMNLEADNYNIDSLLS